MALQTMIEKLNTARREYNAQLAEIAKGGQKEIGAFLGPLIPPGYALKWKQYTPYFNDGDACTFSVHEPYLSKVGEEDEDDDEDRTLDQAIDRYGDPDRQESYQTNDYSAAAWRPDGKYPQKTVTYVVRGFPAIDGYDKTALEKLRDAWDSLPEDVLKGAFGDHVACQVLADGTASVDEYSHD